MLRRDPLSVYFNDHLAGAAGAIELGDRLAGDDGDDRDSDDIARRLRPVIDGIKEDRRRLEDLMDRLGVARDPLKQGLGWIGEKLSRLKLVVGSGPPELGRLLSLEALSAGVYAKRSLWLCLAQLAPESPELSATDLDDLVARADSQLAALDDLRTAVAPRALSGSFRPAE